MPATSPPSTSILGASIRGASIHAASIHAVAKVTRDEPREACYCPALGHECQQIAPACWPATLQPRWGAPGEDLAGRVVRPASADLRTSLAVPWTVGATCDQPSRTTRPRLGARAEAHRRRIPAGRAGDQQLRLAPARTR